MPFDRGAGWFGSLPHALASDSHLCASTVLSAGQALMRWAVLIAAGSSDGPSSCVCDGHLPAQSISGHCPGVAACVLQVLICPV